MCISYYSNYTVFIVIQIASFLLKLVMASVKITTTIATVTLMGMTVVDPVSTKICVLIVNAKLVNFITAQWGKSLLP